MECHSHNVTKNWTAYKKSFSKKYHSVAEKKYRRNKYNSHMDMIIEFNKRYEDGLESYQLCPNHFTDMSSEEVILKMTGFQTSPLSSSTSESSSNIVNLIASSNGEVPATKNWVEEGAVSPVKNQLQCGSCWAFSAIGALEGQTYLADGLLTSLSEQKNLVDCSTSNYGCYGGMMTEAFQYVIDNRGIDTDFSYPYQGSDGQCRYNSSNIGVACTGYVEIPQSDEEMMMFAVGNYGPISAAVDASQLTFLFYSSGVYDNPNCNPYNLNHAILVVGYGTDANGIDYWIIKNSWGTEWGTNGYMHLVRDKNMCGIAMYASYPLV